MRKLLSIAAAMVLLASYVCAQGYTVPYRTGAVSSGGGSAIVCVQGGASCTHTTALSVDCGGGNQGCAKSFGSSVVSGNYGIVIAGTGPSAINTAPATISISTDTQGLTWVCGTQYTNNPGVGFTQTGQNACIAKFNASGAESITAHLSTNGDFSFTIFEVSGLATGAIDASANSGNGSTTSVSSLTTGAFTTTVANEIIIGNVVSDHACLAGQTAGTGFTLITPPACASIGYAAEYKVVSSIQTGVTAAISFTATASGDGPGLGVWTFK